MGKVLVCYDCVINPNRNSAYYLNLIHEELKKRGYTEPNKVVEGLSILYMTNEVRVNVKEEYQNDANVIDAIITVLRPSEAVWEEEPTVEII